MKRDYVNVLQTVSSVTAAVIGNSYTAHGGNLLARQLFQQYLVTVVQWQSSIVAVIKEESAKACARKCRKISVEI